jgi:transposase
MLHGLAKEPVPMDLTLTKCDRSALAAAAAAENGVRRWRRYQAVLRVAAGQAPAAVAQTLGCSRASVYAWVAAWRAQGVAGLREGDHGGGRIKLDGGGEAVLTERLAAHPQTHG